MKRFWDWLRRDALTLRLILALRDKRIRFLEEALEVETRRRENLERILTETVIHPSRDSGRLSQCVLRRNDA